MGVVTKDIDKGWNKFQKELLKFSNSSIDVGFQQGSTTKKAVKGQREKEGGLSMPEIAFENEFGTSKIPARPFMSTSFDENKSSIVKVINLEFSKVERGVKTAEEALNKIGSVAVGFVQKKIRAIIFPPNSFETIQAKGSSKPLIDFGQMVQSVSFVIRND